MSIEGMNQDEKHRRFLREAVRLAIRSVEDGGGPFGTVIVRDGEIVAVGTNRVTQDADPTAHAEVVAIRAACEVLESHQLADCDVYASTEPCPMCMGALYWSRPRRVFFASGREEAATAGFDDQFIYDELARSVDARDLDTRRLDIEEAGGEFAAWKSLETRTEY